MDIQSTSVADQGQSIASLAEQHGVARDSLVNFLQAKIQQAREATGQPPLDQSTLEEMIDHAFERTGGQADGGGQPSGDAATSATYTSNARPAAHTERPASGRISLFA